VLYHINKESFNICVDFINSMLSNSSESFIDVFDVNTIHLGCSKECKSIKKCCKRREK
ncbi:ArsR family transcriptional regulator, partial [Clostridioides difficile]|nr:ArsR family transcriptional regulator [Clostridioides difficile]